MLAVTYYLSLTSYFALLSVLFLWHTWLAPSHSTPVAFTLLVLVVPLLLFMRGLLHDKRRSFLLISIFSLFYFALGVGKLYSGLDQQFYAISLTILSLVLHLSSLFHVNALVRKLRREAMQAAIEKTQETTA